MKKYHIYGMGNALVDMEIEVSNEFITETKIEKCLMILVDENRQAEVLKKVGSHHKRACGGSAANTIIGARQLGARTFYSCKVANDETGEFYFSDLVKEGVQTNLHGEREAGVTGKCMVFVTPDAERSMETYLGITATFSEEQLEWDELKDSEYLYIEGYLVTGDSAKNAAIKARRFARDNGVKVAFTFSDPGIVAHFKDGLAEIMGDKIDLLFCNEGEAMAFTGKEDINEAMTELAKVSHQVAITQGPRGALLWDGNKEIDIVTKKVEAVDTNGAGDLFAGAFMFALTHGHSFSEAGKLACACSSELVTQFGPRLKAEQVKEIYKSIIE
ncbi:MAG: adenosine kinase [Halobacteriovoraceae bacterium]|nr:adenosine kinase [Halobacteriovoraceae bacterium]